MRKIEGKMTREMNKPWKILRQTAREIREEHVQTDKRREITPSMQKERNDRM